MYKVGRDENSTEHRHLQRFEGVRHQFGAEFPSLWAGYDAVPTRNAFGRQSYLTKSYGFMSGDFVCGVGLKSNLPLPS